MAIEALVGSIPAGWEYTTLAAACEQGGGDIQTGPFGSQLHAADYVPDGIPSIMPQNIGNNRVIEDGIARITPADASRLRRYLVRKGDIVYSRRGDVERRALVRDREDGWLCGTGCLRIRFGDNGADPRYASYYLGHPSVREWITRHAHGATMPNLNTSILGACPFVAPPLHEQRAIAEVLGTLDDKIETNRRINDTLEALARALFKSWFVDFEPVRANITNREPDLPTLAALFPRGFVDSALGPIPVGWRVESVYSVADVRYGAPFASNRFNSRGVGEPLLRIRDLETEAPTVWTDESHPRGFKVKPGDVVVGMDGEFRAHLWGGVTAWLNQRLCVFVPKKGYTAAFVRSSILGPLADVEATETGTTVIHLGKADIDGFRIVVPSSDVLTAFDSQCQTWYDRIVECKQEARVLASLRDALLPKLVSGELRVRDADRFLKRAI